MFGSSWLKKRSRFGVVAVASLFLMFLNPTAAQAVDASFTSAPTPTFSGIALIGETFTVATGNWSPMPDSFTYQWKRDSVPISGATASQYVIAGEDYLKYISVSVTASRTGYVTTSRDNASGYNRFLGVPGTLENIPTPEINGIMMVGEYLVASKGVWPEGVTFKYRWLNNSYAIYGATSETYQILSTDKNDRISLELTASKVGYSTVIKVVNSLEFVKPATPKITWLTGYSTLTGKNTLEAVAKPSFGTTDRIRSWCFTKNGVALDLLASAKGVYFVDNSNRALSVSRSNPGCYSSLFDDLLNAKLRVDVTGWSEGAHALQATATDIYGMVSKAAILNIQVAKTAPSVTGLAANFTAPVKEVFSVSAATKTHSPQAPVISWCLTVDGLPVGNLGTAIFKNSSSSPQDSKSILASKGCFYASLSNIELAQGDVALDSTQFSNGDHELGIKVMSQDSEGTFWWSDLSKTSFKIKNPYIPVVTLGALSKKVVAKGAASRIVGSIRANIPGTPSKITLSTQDVSGEWVAFYTGANSNIFSSSKKFVKNTAVQIELFDEDNLSALVVSSTFKVAPVVRLAKPRVAVTGSTNSSKVTKTVTLNATSAGLTASCLAKWPSGSKAFKMAKGKGSVVFQPRSGGSASVICTAAEMAPSVVVSARY